MPASANRRPPPPNPESSKSGGSEKSDENLVRAKLFDATEARKLQRIAARVCGVGGRVWAAGCYKPGSCVINREGRRFGWLRVAEGLRGYLRGVDKLGWPKIRQGKSLLLRRGILHNKSGVCGVWMGNAMPDRERLLAGWRFWSRGQAPALTSSQGWRCSFLEKCKRRLLLIGRLSWGRGCRCVATLYPHNPHKAAAARYSQVPSHPGSFEARNSDTQLMQRAELK